MKKGLTLLATMFALLLAAGCSDDVTQSKSLSPEDLKPPLGLKAISGDQQVTLEFQSANNEDGFYGFAAFMVDQDLSNDTPGSIYDDPNAAAFDTFAGGDGNVVNPEEEEVAGGGVQPVAMTTGGYDLTELAAENTISGEIPGTVSWTIVNGAAIPELSSEEGIAGADDDDDAAGDDDDAAADDDDDAASVYPSASTGDDDDDDDGPVVTGGGTLALANGTKYTAFVCATVDEGAGISWTSNYASFVPRPASAELTITPGAAWSCAASDTDGLDIGNGADSSFTVIDFDTCSGQYAATAAEEAKVDLVIEASSATSDMYGLVGAYPYLSAANGGLIQDLGYFADWNGALAAPAAEGSYVTPGISILAVEGHVYAIRTGDGHFAKVWIKAIDATTNAVTLVAAYQTLEGETMVKQ